MTFREKHSMNSSAPYVLTLNGGSSSIKFALFNLTNKLELVLKGKIKNIGQPSANFSVEGTAEVDNFSHSIVAKDYTVAAALAIDWIVKRINHKDLNAIGHRLVYGGNRYWKPEKITADMITELRKLSPLDPEHLPEEILLVEACAERFPGIKQIACFDTAFHHAMPRVAQLLSIPRRYMAKGIRRFGFHGLSCAYIMQTLAQLENEETAQGKTILAHLGNGASVTAVNGGKSVDTSMGLTPSSGLPMGTRAGDIDPGLGWYLAQTERMNATQFHHMINHESGLLGVSEISADMSVLLKHEANDSRAADAISLFCYQTKKWICAMAATLNGLDTLVFSGGIGENSPEIRARICGGLEFIGVNLNLNQNSANAAVISSSASRVLVRVINTDEELMIAQFVKSTLKLNA
jgi:acetate kinase